MSREVLEDEVSSKIYDLYPKIKTSEMYYSGALVNEAASRTTAVKSRIWITSKIVEFIPI